MARELVAFQTIDGTSVPPSKRAAFAKMQVARWTPFVDGEFHVAWVGDRGMAWAWSRQTLLGDPVDALPSPRRALPESLFRGAPLEQGEELVSMDFGVEGRVWRDGSLVASEWWPQLPTLADWNQFRRGSALPPAASIPVPAEYPLSEIPWTRYRRATGLGEIANRHRRTALLVVAGLCAAMIALPLASGLRLRVARALVEREMNTQDASLTGILAARDAAMSDVDRMHALLALRPPAGQIELMATVVGLMPGEGARVLEWRMPDAESLDVLLQVAKPDPAALAKAWEASPRLDRVEVELGQEPDTVRLRARIVRIDAGFGP